VIADRKNIKYNIEKELYRDVKEIRSCYKFNDMMLCEERTHAMDIEPEDITVNDSLKRKVPIRI
jgi:hypothetical protein